mmetsp:Transcript_32636/g.49240  ORF Transcript_32636/g.49240 Transcript_32636/m.49240 type:complete len:93 (+) Transcript_32636:62-340(+)
MHNEKHSVTVRDTRQLTVDVTVFRLVEVKASQAAGCSDPDAELTLLRQVPALHGTLPMPPTTPSFHPPGAAVPKHPNIPRCLRDNPKAQKIA